MVKANLSHDCSFLRQDGSTEVGLTLTTDPKTGAKKYAEVSDPTLAQQFFTGIPDLGHLPPEKEFQAGADDWRAGFGQEYYDSTDKRRYYSSLKADGRFKNRVMAGPLATAVTLPTSTAPAIIDAGLEDWTDVNTLRSWTKSGTVTIDREDTTKHGDTYSAKLSTADGHIYQNLATT